MCFRGFGLRLGVNEVRRRCEPRRLGLHEFRKETDIPVCFTLDAGPNVHVLYPDQHAEMVERFIMDELEQYCFDGRWIPDQVGEGASRL